MLTTELRSHAVVLCCYWCCLQTVPSRTVANCSLTETVCQRGQLLPGTTSICLTSFFFSNVGCCRQIPQRKESAQRHGFVGIAVRLTIGPLTSLVTYTAVVFLAGYLLTCGDVESNPGPGEGQDYPWYQPPTRHGTTTDIISPQAPCSTGERSQS